MKTYTVEVSEDGTKYWYLNDSGIVKMVQHVRMLMAARFGISTASCTAKMVRQLRMLMAPRLGISTTSCTAKTAQQSSMPMAARLGISTTNNCAKQSSTLAPSQHHPVRARWSRLTV